MTFSQERQGELLIVGEGLIWAFFPVIAKLTYASLSPLYTAGISALFAALFFITLSLFQGKVSEWHIKESYKPILLSTFCIGILFYGLMFIGVQYTSAGNVALLAPLQIFFTILILRIWNKEKMSRAQVTGSVLMILGVLFILMQNGFSPKRGDILVIIAAMIPPIGNYYAKEARKYVSSSTLLVWRNLIAGVFFLVIASIFFPIPSFKNLENSFFFLSINGFLLFGLSKLMWVEGIHRILIGKAISLSSIGSGFSLVYAFLFLKEIPTVWQIAGLIAIIAGVYFLTRNKEKEKGS